MYNEYVFKQHSKKELIKIYAEFYTLCPNLDLFTFLCMHFKKEDFQFISDCFVQMIGCPDLDFEFTDEVASKGNIDYAIVYAKKEQSDV